MLKIHGPATTCAAQTCREPIAQDEPRHQVYSDLILCIREACGGWMSEHGMPAGPAALAEIARHRRLAERGPRA